MTVREIGKSEWHPYFERMSKALTGKRAEIEIASLSLGHQIEAEWLPLLGITYDPKSDVLEVALDGLDHMITHPDQIYVDETGLILTSLEIIGRDVVSQIIQLRDALALPAPSGAAG